MATAMTTTTSFRKTTLSHAQKTVLAMSRAQFLDAIRASRPADKLYVGVCIFRMDAHSSRPSVLLLRRRSCAASTTSSSSEASSSSAANSATTTVAAAALPVLRRESRRNERQHFRGGARERGLRGGNGDGGGNGSGVWELPGGKIRDADFCISAAVARRVAEQTGLRVVRVLGALQDIRHVSEVRILDWDDDGVGIFTGDRRSRRRRGGGGVDDGEESNDSSTDLSASILDGATLTSGTGADSPGSSIGGRRYLHRTASRRSPVHNPQLVLRRECLQLNYAVLVQSHDDLSIRSRDHDELVWASFSRAEALPMHEELRTVVHQGLAFAGEYLF